MASRKRMSGAEIVIKALVDQGVEVVFGYPGGAVLPIYDAIFQQNQIRHVLVRHEQGAVHMAEGYARSTGSDGCVDGFNSRCLSDRPSADSFDRQ